MTTHFLHWRYGLQWSFRAPEHHLFHVRLQHSPWPPCARRQDYSTVHALPAGASGSPPTGGPQLPVTLHDTSSLGAGGRGSLHTGLGPREIALTVPPTEVSAPRTRADTAAPTPPQIYLINNGAWSLSSFPKLKAPLSQT